MIGDPGPYIEMDGPGVWVPRTVPYRQARAIASEAVQEPDQYPRYVGKVDATLIGFACDRRCEETCERRWREGETMEYEDTGDLTCEVPSWHFVITERSL